MRTKVILIITTIFIGLISLNAQDKGNQSSDFDRLKKERAIYFTQKLNLSDSEAKSFIPLLDEFLTKKYTINKDYRRLVKTIRKKNNKITDAEYTTCTEKFLDSKIKEAELQKEYYKKFMKILPADKVYKLQFVEVDFMKQVLEKHNRHRQRGR